MVISILLWENYAAKLLVASTELLHGMTQNRTYVKLKDFAFR